MEEIGEFLERLGRRIRQMERRYGGFGEDWFRGDRFEDGEERGEGDSVDGEVSNERELPFGETPDLHFSGNLMSVALLPVGPGEKARAVLQGHGARHAQIEIGEWGGAVSVDVQPSSPMGMFRHMRRQRLVIYIPAGTRVRGKVDVGRISAERLENVELDLRSDAGKVEIEDCSGRVRLGSSAGKVSIHGFTGSLEARAEAGSIRCDRLSLEPGTHLIETKLGSADVTLSPGIPVRIETRATFGSVSNSVPSEPEGTAVVLRVLTEMGSIRIRTSGGAPTPMRSVPFTDERRGVDLEQPVANATSEPPFATSTASSEASSSAAAATATAERPSDAGAQRRQIETDRILGMLERHEITAGEAAALLNALRS